MSESNYWPWIPEPRPATCPECGVEGMLVCDELLVLEGGLPHMKHGVGCLENQVARLQAIVDKLAVTADGVPVVCPMTVWVVYGSVIHEYRLSGYDHHREMWTVYFEGGGFSAGIDWSHVFSTREAAQAAKDAPSPSTHAPQKGTGNATS